MNPALECHEPSQDDTICHHHQKPTNATLGHPTTATAFLNVSRTVMPLTMNVPSKRKIMILEPQTTSTLKMKHHTALCRRSKPKPCTSRTACIRTRTGSWRTWLGICMGWIFETVPMWLGMLTSPTISLTLLETCPSPSTGM